MFFGAKNTYFFCNLRVFRVVFGGNLARLMGKRFKKTDETMNALEKQFAIKQLQNTKAPSTVCYMFSQDADEERPVPGSTSESLEGFENS